MLAGKRVLGLCVTKIHDRTRADLVDRINRAALAAGFKLVCFNSTEDFYKDNVYSIGAKSSYDRIDYSVVDGLILCAEHFYSEEVVEGILSRARENGVPVVVLNGEEKGCYQVRSDCEEAFRELIRHLIRDHHVTDTFFIAGRREKDSNSAQRLQIYRETLEEEGIPFDGSRVAFGEYWDEPAMRITQELAHLDRIPQAFICANDSMAFGVCRQLKELGYRVPEDVIVTGFDGIPAVSYLLPRLSTCREDRQGLAEKCVETFVQIFEGRKPEKVKKVPYTAVFSESCGCDSVTDQESRLAAAALYRHLEDTEAHEDYVASEVSHLLNIENVEEIYQPLSKLILANSTFCLNSEFLKIASGKSVEGLSVAVPCYYDRNRSVGYLPDKEMLPDAKGFAEDESCYIITSIYSKDKACGYYAVRTDDISSVYHKIKVILRYVDLVVDSLLIQFNQKNMMWLMENAGYMDSTTGFANLKGVSRWFEEFAKVANNHRKTLAFSIYALPNYTYIYENYGIRDIEDVMTAVAERLKEANQKDCFLAKISESEFLVINYFDDPEAVPRTIQSATSAFYPMIEEYNRSSGKDYYVEVNAGCTVADAGWAETLEVYIKCASGELFLNRLKQGVSETVKETVSHKDYYSVFNLLVDNNLFTYHFQPIVDAKLGEICAYEALMRTSGGINLSPLDVLDIAKEFKRLNEIEHATLFNVMKRYTEEFEKFRGRKVFINTIPNHFLSNEECDELISKYKSFFDYFVFEVTEQETSSDEELKAIKRLCGSSGEVQIAVDDYGTGHSNIVNLLRYEPQIIKIDRYLIDGIDSDTNKQMFVKNTIEFASMNNIKVLAEGVETVGELRTVIRYGVDLIQGYYTGRPAPEPIEAISEKVRDEIIDENLRLSKFDNDRQKVYTARDGETLNLVNLTLEKYNYINIVSGEVTLLGKKECTLNIITRVADNAKAHLILVDVNLSGTDEPAVQLGQGSSVELEVRGFDTITKNGIWVSKNSELRLTGGGSLLVNSNQNDGVGIGSRYEEAYGSIILEHTGRVKVISSGDKAVSVGGGYSSGSIEIRSGILEVAGSGISVIGIGSSIGDADIQIGDAEILVKESGNEAVGIGTTSGTAKIVSRGRLDVVSDGERAVAIGSLKGKECLAELASGEISAVVHCDMGAVVGSYSGSVNTVCGECRVKVYGEGASVTGMGSSMGSCVTEIKGGILDVRVLSANAQPFGNEGDKVIITGGNVMTPDWEQEVPAVNAYGQKLHRELKEEKIFGQLVHTAHGDYIYRAERCAEPDLLSVYLP